MKTVGEFYPEDRLPFSYKKVDKDDDGWASAKDYRPLPFDLVHLIGEKGYEDRNFEYTGWWTGNKWFSLRLREGDKVKKWKRPEEAHG